MSQGNEVEEVKNTSAVPNNAELDNSEFCDTEMNDRENERVYEYKKNEHKDDFEFVVEEHVESKHTVTVFESAESSQFSYTETFAKSAPSSFGLLGMPEI